MNQHPNATAAVVSGAIATVIVGTADLFGVALEPAYGAACATIIVTVVLFIGRRFPGA